MNGVCIVGCGMWCPCVCTVCCIDGGGDAAGSRLIQFTAMQRDNCPAVSAGCGVNMCVYGRECDHIVDFGRSERTIVRPQARPVFRWMFFFFVLLFQSAIPGAIPSFTHTHGVVPVAVVHSMDPCGLFKQCRRRRGHYVNGIHKHAHLHSPRLE